VTEPWVRVEPLDDSHLISDFSSGRESVDTWFREKARGAAHLTSTKVCVDAEGKVCAFFALTSVIINVSGLPNRLKRAGDNNGYAVAIMLAQMGLAQEHQGQGHGRRLFFRAAQEAALGYEVARVQLLVLDAADASLIPFYEGVGMKLIPNSTRLVALLSKIPKPGA
jgi:hypothetical protein